MKKKYMTVPFEIKNYKEDADAKTFTVEGYASVFHNVDLGGDRVMPHAFDKAMENVEKGTEKVIVLWMHDMKEPIGVPSLMKVDEHGLFTKTVMPLDDDFVKGRVMPQVKVGSVDGLSIGYGIRSGGANYVDEEDVWELTDLKLYEYSLVPFPMNQLARVTSHKSVDEYESRLPIIDTIDNPEKTYYLLSDEEKFPYAVDVDGKKTLVKSMLTESMALLYAKKGIDGEKVEAAEYTLGRYLKDAKLDSQLKSNAFKIDKFNGYSIRTLENLLKKGIRLSGNRSKQIAKLLIDLDDRDDQAKQRDVDDTLIKQLNAIELKNVEQKLKLRRK